jgi:hypothetical protein
MTHSDTQETLDALQRLRDCGARGAWSADESNQIGFAIDLDFALESTSGFSSYRVARGEGGCSVQAEWEGDGDSIAAIQRDVFRFLGYVAEATLFCERELAPESIIWRLATGSTTGSFAHGHFVTFEVSGQRVQQIIGATTRNAAQLEQLPRAPDGRPILRIQPPGASE